MKIIITLIITVLSVELLTDLRPPQICEGSCALEAFIVDAAVRHNLDPNLFRSILWHESRLKVSAVNKRTKDYGIGQVNAKTAKALGYNLSRLTTDVRYSLDAAASVLAYFKRYERREPFTWYCRYNAGTASYAVIEQRCHWYLSRVHRDSPMLQKRMLASDNVR
jgi:soluble lytic murein transglycosylase-like protein